MCSLSDQDSHFICREYPALDGIRGLAIILVMISHFSFTSENSLSFFPSGALGVDMFLVLSGFLIVSALFKDYERFCRIRYDRFYLRRAARILPALILFLLVCWTISIMRPDIILPSSVTTATIGIFTFSLNFMMISRQEFYHPLSSLWSLSLEEQFYLILPFTLAVLLKVRTTAIWIIIALLPIVISILTRYPGCFSLSTTDPCWVMEISFGSSSRFMGQTLGVILGCLWRFGLLDFNCYRVQRGALLSILFSFSYILFANFSLMPSSCFGFDLICLGTTGLIIFAMCDRSNSVKRFLQIPFLRFSGTISYGLYLWHAAALWIASKILSGHFVGPISAIAASYLIAIISFYWLERPVLRRVGGMLRNDYFK